MRRAYLTRRTAVGGAGPSELQAKAHCEIRRDPDRTQGDVNYLQSVEGCHGQIGKPLRNCGGKFGLVCYHHWGLRFCRKVCKHNFLAKTAKDYAHLRTCFGFLGRGKMH